MPNYDVPAVRTATQLIELLANTSEPMGVSRIAREIGTNKNMAYRLLNTLSDLGWVEQVDQVPNYALTLKPYCVTSGPVNRLSLKQAAETPLVQLHAQTGESCYLSIRMGESVIHIEHLDGVNPIKIAGQIGVPYALHAAAPGKVLLAAMSESDIRKHIGSGLERFTEKTITDEEELIIQLAQVRASGVAYDNEEICRGLFCVAAPVRGRHNEVVGAMGISLPLMTYSKTEIRAEIMPLVVKAAATASSRLGYKAIAG